MPLRRTGWPNAVSSLLLLHPGLNASFSITLPRAAASDRSQVFAARDHTIKHPAVSHGTGSRMMFISLSCSFGYRSWFLAGYDNSFFFQTCAELICSGGKCWKMFYSRTLHASYAQILSGGMVTVVVGRVFRVFF